jgi:hypothetical protein
MGLLSFITHLEGKHVQVLSDTITTVAFLNNMGGSTSHLDTVARNIHITAMDHNIIIGARFLPGMENYRANQLSRIKSTYEWKLQPNLINMLDRILGPHDIDCLRSSLQLNCQFTSQCFGIL